MSKYTAKKTKKQDIIDKSTKKKSKNGVLAYFMEKKQQNKSNTCKNRIFLNCAWKKTRKDALAISVMMAYLKQEEKKEFIFLTLTAPNVPADELNHEIKHYNQSFQRLMQRKEVK